MISKSLMVATPNVAVLLSYKLLSSSFIASRDEARLIAVNIASCRICYASRGARGRKRIRVAKCAGNKLAPTLGHWGQLLAASAEQ